MTHIRSKKLTSISNAEAIARISKKYTKNNTHSWLKASSTVRKVIKRILLSHKSKILRSQNSKQEDTLNDLIQFICVSKLNLSKFPAIKQNFSRNVDIEDFLMLSHVRSVHSTLFETYNTELLLLNSMIESVDGHKSSFKYLQQFGNDYRRIYKHDMALYSTILEGTFEARKIRSNKKQKTSKFYFIKDSSNILEHPRSDPVCDQMLQGLNNKIGVVCSLAELLDTI